MVVDEDPLWLARLESESGFPRQPDHAILIGEWNSRAKRKPGDRPVHGAGIDIGIPQLARQPPSHRALACAGWSVYGDGDGSLGHWVVGSLGRPVVGSLGHQT